MKNLFDLRVFLSLFFQNRERERTIETEKEREKERKKERKKSPSNFFCE